MKLRYCPLLASLVIGLIVLASLTPALAGPKAYVPQLKKEVGPVYQGEVARAEFEVFNQGDQELVINKVSPG